MRGVAIALAVSLGELSPASFAQVPTGGVVQTGTGTISGDNKNLLIQQASQKLGIDWQSYNIGAGNRVRYEQPNAQAIALNRVIGNNRSEIYGAIDANGQVFLINPNGILFGRTAEINVGGLFASTRDISQADFAAGKYSFSGTGDASIINQGQLKALEGGSIVLAGREVRNEGSITADKGRVELAAGETINLSLDTNNQLTVVVNATAANALVDNSGLITANNGQVFLTAKGRDMALDNAINLGGLVQAHGGTVVADGGDSGVVQVNGGTVDVSNTAGQGGAVVLSGQYVGVLNHSTINAAGSAGGGKVIIGGDQLNKVSDLMSVRLADKTIFDSSSKIDISSSGGDGGFVETSGQAVNIEGAILGTFQGKAGQWLIDPNNLIVTNSTTLTPTATQAGSAFTCSSASGSYVRDSAISAAAADVTLTTTGDIYSDSNVNVSSAKNITLTAANVGVAGNWTASNLIFNQSITGGILGNVNANVTAKSGTLRYYSTGNIDAADTITVENSATFSIYTNKSATRTIANNFVLNGGNIASGGVDGIATGGDTVRSNGVDLVHIFLANGSFDTRSWTVGKTVQYLVVAGGGGGGGGGASAWEGQGGGGAGGMLLNATMITANNYAVVIGKGGNQNTNGQNSSFFGQIAVGGGRGASARYTVGGNGGSGGGGRAANTSPSSGIAGQGKSGGAGGSASPHNPDNGGGGGGAGSAGAGGSQSGNGAGGNGLPSVITGINITYAGGGGGGSGGVAGVGGGGAGGTGSSGAGQNGVDGLGGGGGGGGATGAAGGRGGNGTVVVRYGIANSDAATTVTLSGAVTLGNGTTSTLNAATDSSILKVQGAISGGGHIAINSTATTPASTRVEFNNNANTYTGNTSIINSELRAGAINALGAAAASNVSINAGALLNLSGFNQNVGSLSGGGNISTNSADATLTTGGANINSTFSGLILNGAEGGVLSLVKEGGGNQILTGANTYTGSTTVSCGTLQVGNGTVGSIANTSAITNNANLIFNHSGASVALDFDNDLGSAITGMGNTTIIVGGDLAIGANNISQTGANSVVNIAAGMKDNAVGGTAGNVSLGSNAITVAASGTVNILSDDVADLVAMDANVSGATSSRIATFNATAQNSVTGGRNYNLRATTSGTITSINASKTYDGTSNAAAYLNTSAATLNYSRGLSATGTDNIRINALTAKFVNVTTGEAIHAGQADGLNITFNNAAGSNTINVSGNLWQVKGTDVSNYSSTSGSNISKREASINLSATADKTYDGSNASGTLNTSATAHQAFNATGNVGFVAGDWTNISVDYANGVYDSCHSYGSANNRTITADVNISAKNGTLLSDYDITVNDASGTSYGTSKAINVAIGGDNFVNATYTNITSANTIYQANVTITTNATVLDKVYDATDIAKGNQSAVFNVSYGSGEQVGFNATLDSVVKINLNTAVFNTASAADNKQVNLTYNITGDTYSDFKLVTDKGETSANITKASLTISLPSTTVQQGGSYNPSPSYDGFMGGDNATTTGLAAGLQLPTVSTAVPGNYPAAMTGPSSLDNYMVTYRDGTVIVEALQNTNTLSVETANLLAAQGVTQEQIGLVDQAITGVLQDVSNRASNSEIAPPQTVQAIQADHNMDANKTGAGTIIDGGINAGGMVIANAWGDGTVSAPASKSVADTANANSAQSSGSGARQDVLGSTQLFAPRNLETMSRDEAKQWLNDREQAMKQTLNGAATELEQNPALTEVPYCSQTGSDVCIADRSSAVNRKTGYGVKRALLIGVSDYQDKKIPSLVSPIPDIRMVGQLLKDDIGYQAVEVVNPDKDSVIRAFKRLSEESGPDDSVVVYYAGHGYYSEKLDTGYWLPSDAGSGSPTKWLSNRDITRMMRSIGAQQILLISDSCYSGALVEYQNDPEWMRKVINNKELQTMVLISSGGNEPVSDEGKDNHSVFAYHLSKALKDARFNENSVELYEKVRKDVYEAFPQSPQYGAARLDKEKPLNREFKLRLQNGNAVQ